jgi:hypothetical protein
VPAHRDTGRGTAGDARRAAASPVAGDVAKKGLSLSPASSVAGRRVRLSGPAVAGTAASAGPGSDTATSYTAALR